jgi:hypothetical protein
VSRWEESRVIFISSDDEKDYKSITDVARAKLHGINHLSRNAQASTPTFIYGKTSSNGIDKATQFMQNKMVDCWAACQHQ